MGYAGGRTKNPDYGNLGDHTEAVQIDFDPRRITYADLLALFWKSHEPGRRSWSRQYMNAVFYHDERQRQLAMESKAELERSSGGRVRSEVLPLVAFFLAEDYHQKYLLKQHEDLAGEIARYYPREEDFIHSTAATRLNGYLGGHGGSERLAREIDLLGLSPRGREKLAAMVHAERPGLD